MNPEDRSILLRLLQDRRVASLGVLRDGVPYVAMMPFAVEPASGAVLIHASRLGLHSKGLTDGAPFSLLVHAEDAPSADPLQLPRVSIQGNLARVPRDALDYEAAKQSYRQKYPDAGQAFALGDFDLYRLRPTSARFVAGFGKIFNLKPEDLVVAANGREV